MTFDHATEASIETLVRAFYGKVRRDAALAPIFDKGIGDDWEAHMAKMCDFWGAALGVSRRYRGDMLAAHRRLDGLSAPLFGRWLALFEQTVDEHFAAESGAAIRDRARKTARNLQSALFRELDPPQPRAP